MVAGMPRGVGTSIGRWKREQSDGVMFSFVRWCNENVQIDGGHGAVRSWLVGRIVRTWGYRGVRVGEATLEGGSVVTDETTTDSVGQ